MVAPLNCRQCPVLVLACVVLAFATGAIAWGAEQDANLYTDNWFGFSVKEPHGWARAKLQGYTVPGTIRAAWAGQRESSIVAFAQEPGQIVPVRYLVDVSAQGMRQAGNEVREQDVREIGGKKAMWLVVSGRGTGGAITGEGDIETVQHWVAVPRQEDIVVLLLTTPAADYDQNRKVFERTVESLEIQGKQPREQADAE